MSPGQKLRQLLQEPGLLICPGVHDCLSAQIAEQVGFPVKDQRVWHLCLYFGATRLWLPHCYGNALQCQSHGSRY